MAILQIGDLSAPLPVTLGLAIFTSHYGSTYKAVIASDSEAIPSPRRWGARSQQRIYMNGSILTTRLLRLVVQASQ